MTVLGIESSCDETAASVVVDGKKLVSSVVATSMDLHAAFGGVVPEIAARSHVESIIPVINKAVEPVGWDAIDAIAVTYGAGLGGSLLVGVTTAKTLAVTKNKPLYAINHVEAHVYANFLVEAGTNLKSETQNSETNLKPEIRNTKQWQLGEQTYTLPCSQPQFPVLALIVSGGHSQLVLFRDHFDYTLLGQTRDDAIGEAFDKVAKIIGLPYPGGPSIAEAAKKGDDHKYKFPKARLDHKYEYSFSGPKTAVLRLAQGLIGEDYTFPSFKLAERLSEPQKNDIAASFQRIAVETVVDKAILAYEEFQPQSIVIAGGVAANQELRRQLSLRVSELTSEKEAESILQYTDMKLCTDNGAMIATLGCFKMIHNQPTADPYTLQINPNLSM
jgi:N6-L-threonylcarbamoyladenine synthase